MILELTDPDEGAVFINSDHIVRFSNAGDYTTILLTGEQWFSVTESASYIRDMISEHAK